MPAEISIVEAKPRPIAVVAVTTVLSKWPREFRHSLDQVYAAVHACHVRQNGRNVMVHRSREDGRVDIECCIETERREPQQQLPTHRNPLGGVYLRVSLPRMWLTS
jgi:hypothetical protein